MPTLLNAAFSNLPSFSTSMPKFLKVFRLLRIPSTVNASYKFSAFSRTVCEKGFFVLVSLPKNKSITGLNANLKSSAILVLNFLASGLAFLNKIFLILFVSSLSPSFLCVSIFSCASSKA